jgi:CheY-like chemotaxis protein
MAESSGLYILVVDDVAFMRRLLGGIIRTLGHDVLEVDSGEEAMKLIEKDPPDLIFLDLMMPGISGFKVCEWIRKNDATKKTPVIVCTANQERKTMEQAIRAGATDILCKPVSRDNVRERIDRHLPKD